MGAARDLVDFPALAAVALSAGALFTALRRAASRGPRVLAPDLGTELVRAGVAREHLSAGASLQSTFFEMTGKHRLDYMSTRQSRHVQ